MSNLTELEQAVMEKLLAGNERVLSMLREQLKKATVVKRELTGVGFYTNFAIHDCEPLRVGNDKSIMFGDVVAEVPGTNGIGFGLELRNGCLAQLEGYTFGDELWPENVSDFKLKYVGEHRIFGSLSAYIHESKKNNPR